MSTPTTTPRTDAQEWTTETRTRVVWASFARTLETELARLRAELEVANHSIVSSLLYNTLKETNARLRAELTDETNLHAQTRTVVEELNTICTDLKNAGGPPFVRSEAIRLLRDDQAQLRGMLTAERERVRVLRDALENYQNCVIAGGTNPARAALAATKEGSL
jgi:hypothetical protein